MIILYGVSTRLWTLEINLMSEFIRTTDVEDAIEMEPKCQGQAGSSSLIHTSL